VNPFEVLIPIFGILIVLVPVTGVTLILAARYALRPILRELTESRRAESGAIMVGAQLQQMSEEIDTLRAEVERLREAHDFDRRLLEGGAREVRSQGGGR
jgi:hypothetical protein